MTGRKLHIGGKQRAAGWEVFDANAGDVVDHVGDAADLSRFADDTFEEVYASHVLEHFDYKDKLIAALCEWRRVLAHNRKLLISVPDLDRLAAMFADTKRYNAADRFAIMRMMFGGHVDAHDYHLVGLNREFLFGYLKRAGFRSVERVNDLDRFEDTSRIQFKGKSISLNVVATK